MHISRLITKKTLAIVVSAFLTTILFMSVMLYWRARVEAFQVVELNVVDVSMGVWDNTSEYFCTTFQDFAATVRNSDSDTALSGLVDKGFNRLYITDADGLILKSDKPELTGQIVNQGKVLNDIYAEMNDWREEDGPIDGQIFYTEEAAPDLSDGKECFYFLLPAANKSCCLLVGITKETFGKRMAIEGQYMALNRRIGYDGFDILLNLDKKIVSMPDFKHYMEPFPEPKIVEDYLKGEKNKHVVRRWTTTHDITFNIGSGSVVFDGEKYYYAITSTEYYYVLSLYPYREAHSGMWVTLTLMHIMEIIIFISLFHQMRKLLHKEVVNKLEDVNHVLGKITEGHLEEKVDVRDTLEFDSLSNYINSTVDTLKDYIAEAAAKIESDLAMATEIQTSALPNVFPPFPEHKEFELYATMKAAKEVGGDFYDYYLLNGNTLGVLIADVSGKSIPAAMFMMRAKSVIKSLAERGLPVDEVFTNANEGLCQNNDAQMFVTAWLGFLNISDGKVQVADAGHNPPVLIRNGKASFLEFIPNLMLGGMEWTEYELQTMKLEKGDFLFLYTDGVTEAKSADNKFFGNDRLLEILSIKEENLPACANGSTEAICRLVGEELERFSEGAEQFDDITMLCVRFNGKPESE